MMGRGCIRAKETIFPEMKRRTVFCGSGVCFCKLLFDIKSFVLSIIPSFRGTGNAFIENQTQDTLSEIFNFLK